MDVTDATDEIPLLATRIQSIPEAVQIALEEGVGESCLFMFARALKAYEATTRTRLDAPGLDGAFAQWWNQARPKLPADANFDEYRFLFQDAFARAKSPLGANHFLEALQRAKLQPLPPGAMRYAGSKLGLLVAVCFHLQKLVGDAPFFLSVRDAAKVLESTDLKHASAMLSGLVRDGVLKVVEEGKPGGRRATRFYYIAPDNHEPQPPKATSG
jgi:hypothetical protein